MEETVCKELQNEHKLQTLGRLGVKGLFFEEKFDFCQILALICDVSSTGWRNSRKVLVGFVGRIFSGVIKQTENFH